MTQPGKTRQRSLYNSSGNSPKYGSSYSRHHIFKIMTPIESQPRKRNTRLLSRNAHNEYLFLHLDPGPVRDGLPAERKKLPGQIPRETVDLRVLAIDNRP